MNDHMTYLWGELASANGRVRSLTDQLEVQTRTNQALHEENQQLRDKVKELENELSLVLCVIEQSIDGVAT